MDQSPMNDQAPMPKARLTPPGRLARAAWSLGIGHWAFFGHWSLVIGHWPPNTHSVRTPTRPFRESWGAVLVFWLLFGPAPAVPAQTPSAASPVNQFGQLPLYLEANQGQADAWVQFIARGRDQGIYLSADGATIALKQNEPIGN